LSQVFTSTRLRGLGGLRAGAVVDHVAWHWTVGYGVRLSYWAELIIMDSIVTRSLCWRKGCWVSLWKIFILHSRMRTMNHEHAI
jgi:hypothetical protein